MTYYLLYTDLYLDVASKNENTIKILKSSQHLLFYEKKRIKNFTRRQTSSPARDGFIWH